jgi:cytochrome c-type biogenesis protein CcmH
MVLWLIFAVMSAGVVVALLHPLFGGPHGPAERGAVAVTAVYRDQLAEIEAEARRGLIGAEEAEAARREISRRLLASASPGTAAPSDPSETAAPGGRRRMAAAILTAAFIPLAAAAVYLQTGQPNLPAQPLAARHPPRPVDADMAKLIAAVEARLKEHPEDGRGWDVIAPVYLRLERYGDAAHAFAQAARLLGESPSRLSGLAEAAMRRDDGRITDDARRALTRLVELEPNQVQARFWLAFAKEQDGQAAEALADYEALLSGAPANAPWRPMLEERLAAVRAALGTKGVTPPPAAAAPATTAPATGPGPTAADVDAARQMTPDQRQEMIDGMVAGLAARLDKDGGDLDGWQRLIRALTVLGRKDDAAAALDRARKSLADQPQSLAVLAELAKALGLGT